MGSWRRRWPHDSANGVTMASASCSCSATRGEGLELGGSRLGQTPSWQHLLRAHQQGDRGSNRKPRHGSLQKHPPQRRGHCPPQERGGGGCADLLPTPLPSSITWLQLQGGNSAEISLKTELKTRQPFHPSWSALLKLLFGPCKTR